MTYIGDRYIHLQHRVIAAVTNIVRSVLCQQVLGEPEWTERITPEDLRALTPLIYAHVTPYGTFHLDMEARLELGSHVAAALLSSAAQGIGEHGREGVFSVMSPDRGRRPYA